MIDEPLATRAAPLVGLLLAGLALVGGASAGARSEVTVRVAVTPSVESMPAVLGAAKGFFAAEGLKVRWVKVGGSDASVAAVAGGKADFGVAQAAPLLRIATVNALPLQIVSAASAYRARRLGVVVRSSAGISGPGDLPSKTVAVPVLGGFAYLSLGGWLADNGNDPSTVRVVALPSYAMAPALHAGLIDAAVLESPYLQASLTARSGLRSIADSAASSFGEGATVAVWFTSKRYSEKKAGRTKHFVRAIERSLGYARLHPDALRSEAHTAVPGFVAAVNVPSLENQAVLIAGLALTDQVPDVERMLWRGAPVTKS